MAENEQGDREREWLLRQRDDGLTHEEGAELIGVSRSTISKNLIRIDEGGDIARPLRRKIATYLDRLEREAEERRQEIIDQEAERKRAEDAVRRRRQNERIRKEKREAAGRRLNALKRSLKELEVVRLGSLREVNARIEAKGIDTGGRIHGDGVIYARTLEKFHYADPDAELVGFVPDSHRFPCGWTGAELREGVSAEQRRSASLTPAGTERPEFIGMRPGNVVNIVPYADDHLFWGEHAEPIDERRRLFRARPSWSKGRKPPKLPTEADVDWYGRVLEIETDLLGRGLRFERSIIDWGDDWRASAAEARAVLDELKRGVRRREILERSGNVAAALFRVALLAAVIIAPVLLWDVFVEDAVRWFGDFLLTVAMVALTPFVLLFKGLMWLLAGIGWIVSSIFRFLIKAYDGIVWFLSFPLVLPLVAAAVALVSLLLVERPSRRWEQSPARPWFIAVGITSAIVMFATLLYWIVNAPDPEIEKLFAIH